MRFGFNANSVGIVRGNPWKDAVIKLLEPRSPYRPWHTGRPVKAGQTVIVVLDTDPQSVLPVVARVGRGGDVDRVLAGIDRYRLNGLLEYATVNMLTHLEYAEPGELVRVFDAYTRPSVTAMAGHTSLAAARILLKSQGTCTGCNHTIDLMGENARDRIHVHTIDATRPGYRDWPAVLCDDCHEQMREAGFTNFLDFRYSMHPTCPQCSARHTRRTMYGMPTGPVEEPWVATMGCCVEPYKWVCSDCEHQW